MPNLNPTGSGARMLDAGTNARGFCLVAVGSAVLNGEPVLDHATDAAAAFADAGAAHQHATHAPKDFPMFFTGAGGDGDVVISVGDGIHCVASDYMLNGKIQWGHIGVMQLSDRARQVGGSLRGWTDRFLGYDLTGSDTSGTGTTTPVTDPLEGTMKLVYKSPGTVYTVVGNGAPYPFVGNAADAALFATVWQPGQPASAIPAAQWDAFIAANTPVAGVSGGTADISKLATTVQVQDIADKSDLAITTAIGRIPAPPTKFEASA